jgi:general L-amino acid transport system permease protein
MTVRWWRDVRFWQWAAQILVALLIFLGFFILWNNLNRNLNRLGVPINFDFLRSQAGFAISEVPIPYSPQDPYSRALLIGLLNSLRVMVAGIIGASIVGVTVGIARLSSNWLVRQLASLYVEVLRNLPLLLQLLFWYSAIFLSLPPANQPRNLLGLMAISQEGVTVFSQFQMSSELSALLLGLIFYTGAFIAEVVRGSIQSVPKGQWEAANALGLKPNLTMRLVIFPQALRAMIPPLTSQYLNLAKNSSLAVAVGYPDLYAMSSSTFNQTGRAVEVLLLLMAVYLTISLTISLAMNWWNHKLLHPQG